MSYARHVIGRDRELAAGRSFLDDLTAGAPHPLVLEGEPGIGKTTVWRAILAIAGERRIRVLACRPAPAEVRLSSSGLTDLLSGVERDRFGVLPDLQRAVLEAAMVEAAPMDPAPGPRVLYAAFAGVIGSLAEEGPVIVAIDDIQWLDRASQAALEFALRRAGSRPIGLLATVRRGGQGIPSSLGRIIDEIGGERVEIGPMAVAALHALVRDRLGASLSRRSLSRIAAVAGGNPLYVIEIAREVVRLGEPAAGDAVPLPDTLTELVAARIGRLPRATRAGLLRASAMQRASVEILDGAPLEPAERAGIIHVSDGRVNFAHPLFAATVYGTATSGQRRAVHLALAEVVTDPEERARHLALSASAANERIAADLELAARLARARGAPGSAAELMDLAVRLTPADDAERRRRRMLDAAAHAFHAGDHRWARSRAQAVVDSSAVGLMRAQALRLLGEIRYHEESFEEAIPLLELGLSDVGRDAAAVDLHIDLAYCHVNLGDMTATATHAAAAVELATRSGDDGLHAVALAVSALARNYAAQPLDRALLDQALALEDPDRQTVMPMRPSLIAGILLNWADDVERATEVFAALRRRTLERGEEADLPLLSAQYAMALRRHGRVQQALEVVSEGYEMARMLDSAPAQRLTLGERCYGRATLGDVTGARQDATESRRLATLGGTAFVDLWNSAAVAFLELSTARPGRAAAALAPWARAVEDRGWCDAISSMFLPDCVEALIAIGDLARAEALTGILAQNGRDQRRRSTSAVAARCRSMIEGARGDLVAAEAAIDEAVANESEQLPLSLGRSLLVMGRIRRRSRRKRAARDALEHAIATFEGIGAARWADLARAELERTGVRHSQSRELTPTELRVAELAAVGLTTKRIAEAAFISPKSVESNLAHIYLKLGVGSRAELGRAMAQRTRETPDSSQAADP